MTNVPFPSPSSATDDETAQTTGDAVYALPDAYETIRADPDTQFAPLAIKPEDPREPSWFEEALQSLFDWLAGVFAPIGEALSFNWSVIQWILAGVLLAFILFLVARLIGPLSRRQGSTADVESAEPEWQPVREESLALLEDADQLAAEGRFDEAARLLLKRSVGQIAKARPQWVEPSSTARELAALPKLSDSARRAFSVMSAAVESSAFALRSLKQDDWAKARQAYADFALARIEGNAEPIPTLTGAPA